MATSGGLEGPAAPVLDMSQLQSPQAVFSELEKMLGGLGEWLDVVQVGLDEVDFDWGEMEDVDGIDEGEEDAGDSDGLDDEDDIGGEDGRIQGTGDEDEDGDGDEEGGEDDTLQADMTDTTLRRDMSRLDEVGIAREGIAA